MCSGGVVLLRITENLRIQQPVHLVRRKRFIVKYLVALLVLLRLPAFQNAVLIREDELYVVRGRDEFAAAVGQAYFVL